MTAGTRFNSRYTKQTLSYKSKKQQLLKALEDLNINTEQFSLFLRNSIECKLDALKLTEDVIPNKDKLIRENRILGALVVLIHLED